MLKNTRNAVIYGSRLLSDIGLFLSLKGEDIEGIKLFGNDLIRAKKVYEVNDGANENAVKLFGNFEN
ncbi:hypothetical protein ACFL4Z_01920 [candidate division KSB1 bacterium]